MPDNQHGLGRLVAQDPRDRAFPIRALMAPTLPPRPSAKSWVDPWVGDQGGTGECVGFGTSGFLRTSPRCYRKIGPDEIYDGAILLDEFPENDLDPGRQYGTTVRAAFKWLNKNHPELVPAYRWGSTLNEVLDWLAFHGPVVLGTDWYEAMFNPTPAGFVSLTGGVAGGHCYLALGYSERRKAIRCVNSWGRSWGQKGRFWLRYADFERLLAADGEAAVASKT